MGFAVVTFPEDNNEVAVVPLTWIRRSQDGGDDKCYYPPESTKEVTTLVKHEAKPSMDWEIFTISIMHEYATFHEARSKLKKAEDTSNLSSDEEDVPKKRKVRRSSFRFPDEDNHSEEDSFIVRPPLEKKRSLYPSYPSFPSFQITPPQKSNPYSAPSQSCIQLSSKSSTTSSPQSILQITTPQQKENIPRTTSVCSCDRYGVVVGQLQATVAELSNEIRTLREIMVNFTQNNPAGTSVDNEENLTLIGELPLMEEDSYERFETKLESLQLQNLLLKVLVSVGGRDAKTMTYNCFRRCLSYAVAEKLSYSGMAAKDKAKTRKTAFKSTNLCKVIEVAVKKVHSSSTDQEVKLFMCHWLQQAKARNHKKRKSVIKEEIEIGEETIVKEEPLVKE